MTSSSSEPREKERAVFPTKTTSASPPSLSAESVPSLSSDRRRRSFRAGGPSPLPSPFACVSNALSHIISRHFSSCRRRKNGGSGGEGVEACRIGERRFWHLHEQPCLHRDDAFAVSGNIALSFPPEMKRIALILMLACPLSKKQFPLPGSGFFPRMKTEAGFPRNLHRVQMRETTNVYILETT